MPFQATGIFVLPGMSVEHTIIVLERTGRASEVVEYGTDFVSVKVSGTLSGTFVVAETSNTGAIDKAGLCTSLLKRIK